MGLMSGIKQFFREQRDVQRFLAKPAHERRLVFYSEDIASYNMLQGYTAHLTGDHGLPVVYVTSAPDDPLLTEAPAGLEVLYVGNRSLAAWMARVDSDVLVTTMPDLSQLHVPRPRERTHLMYVFHSLNSIHEVYREGAFDAYDAFLCCGPHHKAELEAHFRRLGRPVPALHEAGYYKLDRVAAAYQALTRPERDRPTVLVAPSWGPGNVLEAHGEAVVGALLERDLRVIVRPHPCFFLPIYPRGRAIVDAIEARFGDHPQLTVERSITSEEAFYDSDLMISDFSGAAWEYALGTLRPVLFLDVARKTLNPNWQVLGLPTFEDVMRHQVGRVVAPDEVGGVADASLALIAARAEYAQRLAALRDTAVYHFGRAAEVGATVIAEAVRGGT